MTKKIDELILFADGVCVCVCACVRARVRARVRVRACVRARVCVFSGFPHDPLPLLSIL